VSYSTSEFHKAFAIFFRTIFPLLNLLRVAGLRSTQIKRAFDRHTLTLVRKNDRLLLLFLNQNKSSHGN
jgi:hypothetical protein